MMPYKTTQVLNDLPGEEWRTIQGYEGLYAISNLGRVMRIGYLLAPIRRKRDMTPRIMLFHNNSRKQFTIAELVAQTFLEKRQNHKHIHHLDGNKDNNRSTNLKYLTHIQHMKETWKLGQLRPCKGGANGRSKLIEEQVKEIRHSNLSIRILARQYNVSHHLILLIKHHKIWKHV